MKGIILCAVLLGLYAGALFWKNGIVEGKKNRHIPTTPEIQRTEGTPVNVVIVSEGEFHKEFRVSGFLEKNGNLNAQISSELIPNIRVGQRVEMRDQETSAKGVVTNVAKKADLFTGLYRASFDFKHFPSSWSNKLRVVYLPYRKIEGLLVVPRAAVSLRDGTPKVYEVKDGRILIKEVQISDTNNLFYAIKSGIAPGSQIVISDQRYLENNEKVKIVPFVEPVIKTVTKSSQEPSND